MPTQSLKNRWGRRIKGGRDGEGEERHLKTFLSS